MIEIKTYQEAMAALSELITYITNQPKIQGEMFPKHQNGNKILRKSSLRFAEYIYDVIRLDEKRPISWEEFRTETGARQEMFFGDDPSLEKWSAFKKRQEKKFK